MQTFKDKARSDLKRAADQHWSDGALEVSVISVIVSVDLFLFLMLFNEIVCFCQSLIINFETCIKLAS